MSTSQPASVCGLSLEAYVQLHKALTKNSSSVQSQSVIEECYYKVQDLKQVILPFVWSASCTLARWGSRGRHGDRLCVA
jgi:hypothetical protein